MKLSYLWTGRGFRSRWRIILHVVLQILVLSQAQVHFVLHVGIVAIQTVFDQIVSPRDGGQTEAEEARRQENKQTDPLIHSLH